ncbi:hypothetical protein KI387_034451, partial [Taxus chinensis]
EYNVMIEFFWAPYLVNLETNEEGKKLLHVDEIQSNASNWMGADVMIFESSKWWPDVLGSQRCDLKEPILDPSYDPQPSFHAKIVQDVLKSTSFGVKFFNITHNTAFRDDGHPSIYTTLKISAPHADCSH